MRSDLSADTNPRFHRLLTRNVRGKQIVCTPEDAFRCFMGYELDVLVIGNCVLKKSERNPALKQDYSSAFELDQGHSAMLPSGMCPTGRFILRHAAVAPGYGRAW